MTILELFKDHRFLAILIFFLISFGINLFQFFKLMRETKIPYSTISFRNMMYTTMALLFAIPITEGILQNNFGIKFSETGLISQNTKEIYYFAMSIFCLPHIVIALGSQFKWFIIAYLATMFRNSSTISSDSIQMFRDIVEMIITEKPVKLESNKEEQVLYTEEQK